MPKYDPQVVRRGERSRLNLGYVNKFLAAFRRASRAQRLSGLSWYHRARQDINTLSADLGLPPRHVAYAVAALSAQMQWSRNLEVVRDLANGLDALGMRGPVEQARACLHGDLSALSGAKVTAFAFALCGDSSAAVIDRWMMRALLGTNTKKVSPTQRQYGVITKALKVAARMSGLTTSQFQAVVWLQVRGTQ